MKTSKPKAIIIHPGTQHAWQMANASLLSDVFSRVHFVTGFIVSNGHILSNFKLFQKRVKPIHPDIRIHNLPFFDSCRLIHKKLQVYAGIPNNNADYIWQLIINCFLLPFLFIYKRNCVLVLYETAGWPLAAIARKWGITVIMDFPSISHEQAATCGIEETSLGKFVKIRERKHIDFGFFCSEFSRSTYHCHTSSKKDFVLYPGASQVFSGTCVNLKHSRNELRLAFIANTEFRKGVDILLMAYHRVKQPKKLFLIGNLNSYRIIKICREQQIDASGIYLTGNIPHPQLYSLLKHMEIDLHILPSRFDSFGMVVPETMSLGIPNIISSFVGISELLTHRKDVLLAKGTDPQTILQEIEYYQQLTQEEKEKFRNRVLLKSQEISWTNYYQRVKRVFTEIVSTGRHL